MGSDPGGSYPARPGYTAVYRADVAELVDAHGSGPCARKGVEVQVLSSALPFHAALVRTRCPNGRGSHSSGSTSTPNEHGVDLMPCSGVHVVEVCAVAPCACL